MRIKMLKTAAGPDGVLSAGSEYDVELEFGQALVMADAAEWLEAPRRAQKAVKAPLAVEEAAAAPKADKAVGRRRRAAKGA